MDNLIKTNFEIGDYMKKVRPKLVICGKCDRLSVRTKPKWKKVGDIEYYYLKCAHCKKIYTISASDTALRKNIERFKKMLTKEMGRQPQEKEMQEAKKLLQANEARSREIMKQYPLETKM